MTGNEKQRLEASGFARSNGKVLRAVNILRIRYNKLTGIKSVLKDDGVTAEEFLESVGFLAEDGYIHLRQIAAKESAALSDSDYAALEAKLTGKGIRLLAGGVEDNMIEINSSDKSALRAGNFIQNNGRVLRTLNILAYKYSRLESMRDILKNDGIAGDEFLDSLNFLAEEGYIHLRQTATKEEAILADSDYATLEAKLTAKGNRLLRGGVKDDMIEV